MDDRGGRLWSVRAHADDGTPLPDAIRQEFLVLQNRSWPEARDALHEMTLLYPGMAEGWTRRVARAGVPPLVVELEDPGMRAVGFELEFR